MQRSIIISPRIVGGWLAVRSLVRNECEQTRFEFFSLALTLTHLLRFVILKLLLEMLSA